MTRLRTALAAGMVAGALDLTYACTLHTLRGSNPIRVCQAVASGLLGPAAFSGGLAAALLGVGCHFAIAVSAAAIYVSARERLDWMRRQTVAAGLLFGAMVYLVMTYVVVPLSASPIKPSASIGVRVADVLAHLFLFGLPIALIAARKLRG